MLKDLLKKVWGGNSSTDTYLYAQVHQEMSQGYLDSGTWTKSIAESGGSEFKAKARYIELRVDHLRRVELATEKHHKLLDREEKARRQRQLRFDADRAAIQKNQEKEAQQRIERDNENYQRLIALRVEKEQYELDLENVHQSIYSDLYVYCMTFAITGVLFFSLDMPNDYLRFIFLIPTALCILWSLKPAFEKRIIRNKINKIEELMGIKR